MHVFHLAAIASLTLAFVCALVIGIDVARHPQKMAVMNVVWPVSALYGSVLAVWLYWAKGRAKGAGVGHPGGPSGDHHGMHHGKPHGEAEGPPTAAQITVATSHCGAGCVLADICVEFALFAFAVTLAGSALWASYLYDFIAAWVLGVVFQYYSIKPMTDLSPGQAILAAIKADTLSITAFQIGMYAWMAIVYFVLFPAPHLRANQPEYWLMMQIAMLFGFATAWPMNRLLVGIGLKERM